MSRRNTLRFGDFIQAMSVDSQRVPFGELMPEPLFDRHGNEHPQPVPKMKLGSGDILKILHMIVENSGDDKNVEQESSNEY